MNPTGLIRCITVAPSGNWVVLGQASGFLTILDTRTGLIIASWKGHECEVKICQQLLAKLEARRKHSSINCWFLMIQGVAIGGDK